MPALDSSRAPKSSAEVMVLLVKRGGSRSELFSTLPPGKILDFPAGDGKESRELAAIGFLPISSDLFAPAQKPDDFRYVQADANRTFPFRSASFDYVLSREGIEHLEYQAQFIRECARVLKPSGRLVLTTPNVLHLYSRLSYLLSGQRTLVRGVINEIQTPRFVGEDKVYHGHAFLIDYFRLRYLLKLAGFDQLEVFTDRFSPSSIALAPLVPIMYGAYAMSVRRSIRKDRNKRKSLSYGTVFSDIAGHVFSAAILFGKRLIVVATKGSLPTTSTNAPAMADG
ncbi:MAG TPA: class I SAM-dependent methyltransferase [Bradyrhizobium sp.]|nr:class I SAM-dependent methyltransferase [Bradyrhizobium sp.]